MYREAPTQNWIWIYKRGIGWFIEILLLASLLGIVLFGAWPLFTKIPSLLGLLPSRLGLPELLLLGVGLLVFSLFSFVSYWFIKLSHRTARDAFSKDIASVCGVVTRKQELARGHWRGYEVTLGSQAINVPIAAYEKIEVGQEVRIDLTRLDNHVVAIGVRSAQSDI